MPLPTSNFMYLLSKSIRSKKLIQNQKFFSKFPSYFYDQFLKIFIISRHIVCATLQTMKLNSFLRYYNFFCLKKKTGYNEYTCTACSSVFVHPNALKAHVFLQCSKGKSSPDSKTDDRLLVPFDRLLHGLNKTSKTVMRKKQEQSKKFKSRKTVNDIPDEKTLIYCNSRGDKKPDDGEFHHRKDAKNFSEVMYKDGDKPCSTSQQEEKFFNESPAMKKLSTSKDGTSSFCPDSWPSPTSSPSLTLSLSSFSSSPLADDSITMSPDSSTDQNSALNLSVRVSSTESSQLSTPVSKAPHVQQFQIQQCEQPTFSSSMAHWSRAIAANNILAQTFASLPLHGFSAGTTANGCLQNALPFGQPSFLANQYYHRQSCHKQFVPTDIVSTVKHHTFPATNNAISPFPSYSTCEQYQHSLSIKHMEELHRQHQHIRYSFQKNYRQQQPHLHKQSNKALFSSPHRTPSMDKNAGDSSPLPPLPQSQHHQNQGQQPHQSSRTSSSNAYGFTLPSDKEPLDLLPQAYFANKSKKGHLCLYCGKIYSRKYGLKIHMRTHNGYKPLKCKICSRPFGDPSNLNKHVRLHAQGETPYRCDYCGKVLVRRRDLDRHIKSRHPIDGVRPEVICDGDHTNAEEDWEKEKIDDGSDEIIDVAGVDGGVPLPWSARMKYKNWRENR